MIGKVGDDAPLPQFLYGTAWKESETQRLTELAIERGFRGIDTANQRRHYHEAAVGQAIAAVIDRGFVSREDLFLQTKFTFLRGQDYRLPYDPKAPVSQQVEQSFISSLEHLGVETLDSYLLHGPAQRIGLGADDWSAWRAMEKLHESGRVGAIGVSNMTLQQLKEICRAAHVPPQFIQNRCYAVQGWDREVRMFCAANGLIYQGFSLLTANRQTLERPEIAAIAKRHARTLEQIIFRFAIEAGILPLTGTSNAHHMRADLEVLDFQLALDEVERIERVAVG